MTMIIVYVCIKDKQHGKANKREIEVIEKIRWKKGKKKKKREREHTTANALCLIELLTTL